MSSQIPPLVCHTPPPIDFDREDDEDDYGPDIPDDDVIDDDGDQNVIGSLDDDFGDFAAVPVTLGKPFPNEAVIDGEPDRKEQRSGATENSFAERMGTDSPPSLVLPPNDFSAGNGEGGEEEDDIDFQPFGCPTQPPDPPPEDCISLPSLHLDADLSRSEEDDNISAAVQVSVGSGIDTEVDLPAAAAERTTPLIQEGSRFDDNTENDFTDFTTASNERSSVVLEIPTANDVSFELDDFAQLESTPSVDSNFVSQQSRTDFATFDADFSKFDSFQASFPATGDDGAVPLKTTTPVDEAKSVAFGEQSTSGRKPTDPLPEDDFDDFQEFATFSAQPKPNEGANLAPEPANDASNKEEEQTVKTTSSLADDGGDSARSDDDDEFGEFSDFQQPENSDSSTAVPTFSMETVHNLLAKMFPTSESPLATDTGQQSWVIPETSVHSQLQDFDNTNAVGYQYSKSSSGKALVTALGIDSRNIMYGPKWNSSMPRFAANLSFNPLEPLKPSPVAPKEAPTSASEKSASGVTFLKMSMNSSLEPPQPIVASSSVPAAQFDWNSSGLVNPLEGVQEMLQKAPAGQPADGAKGEVLDSKVTEDTGPPVANDLAVVSRPAETASPAPASASAVQSSESDEDVRSLDFSNTHGSNAHYSTASLSPQAMLEPQQQQHYPPNQQQSMSISASTSHGGGSVPVMRTIKLPETHIFTPSRGGTPVSRDITDRDIVVREYHDVEYSLERTGGGRKEAELDEFNDFQSVPPVAQPSMTYAAATVPPPASDYARPVIGRSPTEETEQEQRQADSEKETLDEKRHDPLGHDAFGDDDFTDFQAAPAAVVQSVVQPVNKPVSGVQHNRSNTSSPVMLLSPAILLPQQAAPADSRNTPGQDVAQINWPEPGVDPDEMARFEAAFAKPATQAPPPSLAAQPSKGSVPVAASQRLPKPATSHEEDEWTDFISSNSVVNDQPNVAAIASATTQPTAAAQEEWTDFISSAPATGGPTSQGNHRLSSSQNHFNYSRPTVATSKSLSSWSQPQLPPPQFSSWHSASLYYNPMSSLPVVSQRHPPPPTTQNAYYGGGSRVGAPAKLPPNTTQQQQQQQQQHGGYHPPRMAPVTGAVNLLPELSIITPNAAGVGAPGHTKSATHSFLNSVISSNSFAKK